VVVKSHGGEVETVGKTDNRNVVDRVLAVAEAKHDDHEENEVVDAVSRVYKQLDHHQDVDCCDVSKHHIVGS
jgi:hypothetical protein